MAESERVTIRLPAPTLAAATKAAAAAKVSLSEWIRGLVEAETGVATPVQPRTTGLPPARRSEIGRAAIRVRYYRNQ